MSDAACKGDTATFFPEKGHGPEFAKMICGMCPVRPECEAYTAEQKPEHGVWAGRLHQPPNRVRRR